MMASEETCTLKEKDRLNIFYPDKEHPGLWRLRNIEVVEVRDTDERPLHKQTLANEPDLQRGRRSIWRSRQRVSPTFATSTLCAPK